MALDLRVSSTTEGGTANAVSLGGTWAAAPGPSTASGAFFDNVTSTQNDVGHTDYRCIFIINTGSTTMNGVAVSVSNKGGGATVTVAKSSTGIAYKTGYTAAVIANENTAPSITGSFGSTAVLGDMLPGYTCAIWLKRVTTAKVAASTGDTFTLVVSATEV